MITKHLDEIKDSTKNEEIQIENINNTIKKETTNANSHGNEDTEGNKKNQYTKTIHNKSRSTSDPPQDIIPQLITNDGTTSDEESDAPLYVEERRQQFLQRRKTSKSKGSTSSNSFFQAMWEAFLNGNFRINWLSKCLIFQALPRLDNRK